MLLLLTRLRLAVLLLLALWRLAILLLLLLGRWGSTAWGTSGSSTGSSLSGLKFRSETHYTYT